MMKIRELAGHRARVGSISWSGNLLASGSRDKRILIRDLRSKNDTIKVYKGHRQEVCGLKWSPNTH